jgi:hypothetical protein
MDMKTYLRQAPQSDRENIAHVVGSSVAYFYQIAGGHKKPGVDLCKALVAAEPRLTLHELRPDIWSAVMDGPIDKSRRATDPTPGPDRGGRNSPLRKSAA